MDGGLAEEKQRGSDSTKQNRPVTNGLETHGH